MAYCSSCGSEIPEGQGNCCSMCYGDIAYGSDGYYQQWAEQQERSFEQKQIDDELSNKVDDINF